MYVQGTQRHSNVLGTQWRSGLTACCVVNLFKSLQRGHLISILPYPMANNLQQFLQRYCIFYSSHIVSVECRYLARGR